MSVGTEYWYNIFQTDAKIFVYRLKNSNFILESEVAELNWKQNFLIYFENCQDVLNSHKWE